MKKRLVIGTLVVSMAFFTVACTKKKEAEIVELPVVGEEKLEKIDEVKPKEESTEEPVDKSAEEEKEVSTTGEEEIDTLEMLSLRIEQSDYIAIAKLIDGEYEIVENLKGEVDPTKISKIEGFDPKENILLFMMDLDGEVMFTDEDSMILLDDAGKEYLDRTRERI
ncbi:MAG: hypothetical protein GXZ08_03320 [Tissierellia bacterium]|nr:hypothetical protein [Tissierellia bacterium]